MKCRSLLVAWLALLPPTLAHADQASSSSSSGEAPTLSEVKVSAGSELAEREAAVTQKTVVGRREIEALGGLTVGEVLKKLPGIDAGDHSGDGAPAARARGMVRDAVQILVDGERPTANSRFALALVGRLPAGELERIEILRGASAEHGGGAPVTVNLVMKKARPQDSASLKLTAGVRGDEPNGQFTYSQGGGREGFSWLLPVTLNRHAMPLERHVSRQTLAGGSRTSWQEERENSPYVLNEFILSPRFTWKRGGDSLTLWPAYYQNEGLRRGDIRREAYADPAAGAGPAFDGGRRDREESATRIARLRAEGEMGAGEGKLSGRLAVMDGQRDGDTGRLYRDAAGTATALLERLRRDENEFTAALRLDRPVGEHLISAGIEHGRHRRLEQQAYAGNPGAGNPGAGSLDAASAHAARETQWTAWWQDEWSPLPALTLTAGLRGDTVTLAAGGAERRHGMAAPSLALRWAPRERWLLRTSLGSGLKAPKLDELSGLTIRASGANSPLEPDRGGNPELRAEKNVNLEAGIERYLAADAGVLGANLYLRRTMDFIERRSRLEGSRWVERPENAGDALHWGVELDARLKVDAWAGSLLRGASLRAHLTLPHSRVDDRRLGLSREARGTPRYLFTLGYDQALPAWSSSWGFQWVHTGRSRSDIPGELADETRGRSLVDAHIVRRLTPALNLRFTVQNLLAADTHRQALAFAGNDAWRLYSSDTGQRAWLLSLEGKW